MKRFGIGTTALVFGFFAATSCFAQDKPEQHEEKAPAQHEEKAAPAQHEEKAQPAQHEEKAAPAQHEAKAQPAQHEEKTQPVKTEKRAEPAKTVQPTQHASKTEQAKPATQHAQPAKSEVRTSENNRTTTSTRTEHTQTAQRSEQAHNFGGHGGGRISDAKFHASFGNDHHFRMNRPVMYQGYSRFNYGGYYFGFYEPWPAGWGYSDNVYVDYIDGQYYLIDLDHSGPRLMINVVI